MGNVLSLLSCKKTYIHDVEKAEHAVEEHKETYTYASLEELTPEAKAAKYQEKSRAWFSTSDNPTDVSSGSVEESTPEAEDAKLPKKPHASSEELTPEAKAAKLQENSLSKEDTFSSDYGCISELASVNQGNNVASDSAYDTWSDDVSLQTGSKLLSEDVSTKSDEHSIALAVSTKSDEQSIDGSISGLASVDQDNSVASESASERVSIKSYEHIIALAVSTKSDEQSIDGSISGLASVDQDNNVASESASEDVSTKSDKHSIAEAVSTKSDDQSIGETNKKTIVRNFGILENDLDPLLFMDDLYERGCIERDRMDIYKSINPRNTRARRFLLDVICDPTDFTQTLFDVLKEKKYSFVLDELIHEKIPRKGMPGCRHPTCCLTIIKTIITHSRSDMEPVDSGKIIIPLLEESLLPPFYFEDIAFEKSMRKRNENFIKYLENVKDNENDLITVFLDTLTTSRYNIFELFKEHCYKHDGIPSDCQEKWKEQILKQQEMQGNTMKDLQLRNGIKDNIEVDGALYHSTENETLIMKIIPQNISEQESKTIVYNINREKKEINASLSPQRIIEARQGCIQITLAVPKDRDIYLTMKSIKNLLEWGDVFHKIKDKHVIIKLYSIHIPTDTGEENETLSKYRIVRNFPFLVEEIDVLLFVKPFTEKNILSEEDFETKFKIGCSSRKLRTSYFLNYILKADAYCLKAFYEVLKSPNYKFIFDKLVENEHDGSPLDCQEKWKEQIWKQQEMQGNTMKDLQLRNKIQDNIEVDTLNHSTGMALPKNRFARSNSEILELQPQMGQILHMLSEYFTPNDQTLPGKTFRSNSINSSFNDDENCQSFHHVMQIDSTDITADSGYGEWPNQNLSILDTTDQNMEILDETNIKEHPCNKKNISNRNDLKTSAWENQPNVVGKTTKKSDNPKPPKSSQSKMFPDGKHGDEIITPAKNKGFCNII